MNLDHLIAVRVHSVEIRQCELLIRFTNEHIIHIEGNWVILDSSNKEIDSNSYPEEHQPHKVHWLINQKITTFQETPIFVELCFSNNYRFRIMRDSAVMEVASITPNITIYGYV